MRLLVPRSIAILGLLTASAFAQTQPQSDHVYNPKYQVKAYRLTAEEESTFSTADGIASPFWAAWDSVRGKLESVTVDGVNNRAYGPTADRVDDCSVTLKLAYGQAGAYAYFEVQDDSWISYYEWIDFSNDYLEFFGNKHSAEELYGLRTATLLPCQTGVADTAFSHQLSTDYFHLQIRFGGLEPVEQFSMDWWNPLKTDISTYGCNPGTSGEGVVLYRRMVTFEYAEDQYGIKIDILPMEARWRRQEWLIPWAQWGGPNNAPVTEGRVGDKLGICFGYNDLDAAVQTSSTAIRWRKCDPFSNCKQDSIPCTTSNSYDAWGDIVFDIGLDDAVARAGVRDASPFARRSPRGSPLVRCVKGRLEIGTAGLDPRDRILVTDARGAVVMRWDVGAASGPVLTRQAPRPGVYQVRVGDGPSGVFAVR